MIKCVTGYGTRRLKIRYCILHPLENSPSLFVAMMQAFIPDNMNSQDKMQIKMCYSPHTSVRKFGKMLSENKHAVGDVIMSKYQNTGMFYVLNCIVLNFSYYFRKNLKLLLNYAAKLHICTANYNYDHVIIT